MPKQDHVFMGALRRLALLGAIAAFAVCSQSVSAEIVVRRFATDTGLLPEPILPPEVEIVDGVVRIRQPYEPSLLPDYYVYTTTGTEDIVGVEIDIDDGFEGRDVSVMLRNPGDLNAFAARHVGYVRLGTQYDPECRVRKSRVKASRIAGELGELTVRADTAWSNPLDRFGTVEIVIGGHITGDWTFFEPVTSGTPQGGIWVYGDLRGELHIIGQPTDSTPTNPSVAGDELHIQGDITADGAIIASCHFVGLEERPLTIGGDMHGHIHTDQSVVTYLTIEGAVTGTISTMFERFTDRARKVMALANQEAQRFNHEYIGTEHILLGLVKEGSGVGRERAQEPRRRPAQGPPRGREAREAGPDMVTMGKLPQTPRAKKVIEYAIEEARNLNHNYVGTEHLLLGLLREHDGVAAQVLMNLGSSSTRSARRCSTCSARAPRARRPARGGRSRRRRVKPARKAARQEPDAGAGFVRPRPDRTGPRGQLDPVIGRRTRSSASSRSSAAAPRTTRCCWARRAWARPRSSKAWRSGSSATMSPRSCTRSDWSCSTSR
jgi:hypothetical protein